MNTGFQHSSNFLVGGRYTNRLGTYEVLAINGNQLRVEYDNEGEHVLNAEVQNRIIRNMELDTATFEAYSGPSAPARNRRYFRTIGFLASRMTMMEAIVPHRAQVGFVESYRQILGWRPAEGAQGYYVHGPDIDKWGNELRITFGASEAELGKLDFGPGVQAVANPSYVGTSWRVNRNAFWWNLLSLGFRLGTVQNRDLLGNNIPVAYKDEFENGLIMADS